MSCRSPVGNTPHMLHAFGLFCADGVDLHHARHLLGFASGHFARFSCQNHLRLLFRHACIYMPDITASGKRGKEEKDGQTTFFAISHNDIIKNFNECQANFLIFAKLSGMMPASFRFFPIFSHRSFSTCCNTANIWSIFKPFLFVFLKSVLAILPAFTTRQSVWTVFYTRASHSSAPFWQKNLCPPISATNCWLSCHSLSHHSGA